MPATRGPRGLVAHFDLPDNIYPITCAKLVSKITDNFIKNRHEGDWLENKVEPAPQPPIVRQIHVPEFAHEPVPQPPAVRQIHVPEPAPAEDNWSRVGKLQWALHSDWSLDENALAQKVADLRREGTFAPVKRAFLTLMHELLETYPILVALENNALMQLIALGKDMATTVGESPDMLTFVENEIQPVDLWECCFQ